jgi:hypothetical protein
MATDTVFIYTMNRGVQGGAWGRYVFPFTIEHFTHLENTLYMRHEDDISFVIEGAIDDDGVGFEGVIQWPWLDLEQPGVEKQLLGFDIVGTGTSSIEIGYDQTNFGSFTTKYPVPVDTYPGQVISMPVMAPAIAVRLTYDKDQDWQWNSLNLYLQDMRPTS